MDGPIDPARSLPDVWRQEVQQQLQDGESLLAWFEPDLDQRLRYAKRLVVLTDRRLIGFGEIERKLRPIGLSLAAPLASHAAWPISPPTGQWH